MKCNDCGEPWGPTHDARACALIKPLRARVATLEALLKRAGALLSMVPLGQVRGSFSILGEIARAIGDFDPEEVLRETPSVGEPEPPSEPLLKMSLDAPYVPRASEASSDVPDFGEIARATLDDHEGKLTSGELAHELAMAYEAGQQNPEQRPNEARRRVTIVNDARFAGYTGEELEPGRVAIVVTVDPSDVVSETGSNADGQ